MLDEDYTPRNWVIAEVPLDVRYPAVVSDEQKACCGLGSAEAESRIKRRSPVFYYDWEQEVAGLDATYGIGPVERLTEPAILPDGTVIPAGRLHVRTHKTNDDFTLCTHMFEVAE